MNPQPERDRSRYRLLMLGPMPMAGEPVGGTRVMFGELLRNLHNSGTYEVEVVDTSRETKIEGNSGWWANLKALLRVTWAVFKRAKEADAVVLNASSRGLLTAGPWIWWASVPWGTPVVVRLFGGGFDLEYDRAAKWRRFLCDRTFMRTPLFLVETRALCRRFRDRPGMRWFPNMREMPKETTERDSCKKFLFLGHLKTEKGVREALEASDELAEGCSLTLAGRPMDGFDPAVVQDHPHATWIGEIHHQETNQLLNEHDALIFPSYYEGEGYPGSIIEAMQRGLPVIAADWRSINEIVETGSNGLLISGRSTEHLSDAMKRLAGDSELYRKLSRGALASSKRLDSNAWIEHLEDWIFQVCDQGFVSATVPFYELEEQEHETNRQTV